MRASTKKWILRGGNVIGTGLVFVIALAGGAILHLDTDSGRRLVGHIASRELSNLFRGTFTIEGIKHISADGVEIGHIAIDAPPDAEGHSGERVIDVRDFSTHIALARLVGSVLDGGVDVRLSDTKLGTSELVLGKNANGGVEIADCFASKKPSAPSAPNPNAKKPRVEISSVEVSSLHAHGALIAPLDGVVTDMKARFLLEDDTITIDASKLHVRLDGPALGNGATRVEADVVGGGVIPLDAMENVSARADVKATAGTLTTHATAVLKDGTVIAHADVPRADANAWNAVLPGVVLTDGADATVDAIASRDAAVAFADVHVGKGDVSVRAIGTHDDAWRVHADVNVTSFDTQTLATKAPKSTIDVRLTADGAVTADGKPHAVYTLKTGENRLIKGQTLPAVVGSGTVDEAHATADLVASEPGAPTHVTASFAPLASNGQLTFVADSHAADPTAIRRVKIPVHGDTRVHVTGKLDVAKQTIVAQAAVDVKNLEAGPATAETVHATASVTGPLTAPQIDAQVDATEVAAGQAHFSEASARSRVTIGKDVTFDDARVAARREHAHVEAIVKHASVGPSGLSATGVEVLGLGAPFRADMSRANGETHIEARGRDVQIESILKLAGLERLEGKPKARVDASIRANKDGVFGTAHVELQKAEFRGVPVSAQLTLNAQGRDATVNANAELTGVAKLDLAEIHAHAADGVRGDLPEAWTDGTLESDARGEIDVAAALAALLTDDQKKTFPRVSGLLLFSANAEGANQSPFQRSSLTATTRGLIVQTDTASLAGVDGSVTATIDDDGDAEAAITTWDKKGTLATIDAKTLAPWWTWLSTPDVLKDVSTAPLEVRASVPVRSIASFPFAPTRAVGEGGGTFTLSGNLRAPTAALFADLTNGDEHVSVGARYDGHALSSELDTFEGVREVARLLVQANVDAGRLIDDHEDPTWSAGAILNFKKLDLAKVPGLPRGTAGTVNGHATLEGLHKDASVDADIDVTNFAYSGAKLPHVATTAKFQSGVATASLDVSDGKGRARANGTVYAFWGGDLAPRLDPTRGIRASYALDSFRLVALKSLLRKVTPELDGTVTGTGSYDSTQAGAQINGGIQIKDGLFYATTLGEEISNIDADIKLQTSRVTVESVRGRISSGDFVGAGWVQFKGTAFDSAGAALRIDDKGRIPVSVEGATLATASGELDLSVASKPNAIEATLNAPHLHVELPSLSARQLQSLDDNTSVSTGVQIGGKFEPIALSKKPDLPTEPGKPFVLTAKLGDDVYIAQGSAMKIQLRGEPTATIGADTKLSGKISLGTGYAEVQGRRFIVDNGEITWDQTADPANPTVVASAHWDAPEGTTVTASFTGPVKTGKLALSSDPAYSQSEILSLLLTGSPDGNQSSSTQGNGSAAGGAATAVGGGLVTKGLNQALTGLVNVNVETSVDTTENNSPRPRITVRLANDITLDLAYVVGTPTPKDPDTELGTVSWHFLRNWTVSTTYGDTGTTLFDLGWQYRY